LRLLNLRAEFVHAVEVAAWREACVKHADDMARIRIEAIADLRRRHGEDFGHSVGGRWAISIEVSKRFNALLAADGVHPPTPCAADPRAIHKVLRDLEEEDKRWSS